MSWISNQGVSRAVARGGSDAPSVSQGLDWLWQHLRDVPHPKILDCGPVSPATLQVLLRRGAKLYVADLITPALEGDSRFWDRTGKTPVFQTSAFLDQLPQAPEGSLTAILSWNLLDFVPREALQALVERLFSLLEPLGVIFILLRESSRASGAERRWRLETLTSPRNEIDSNKAFPYPPITNREIERLLPDASIKAFLTRSGRREILAMRRE
ncbi:MAG TPA: hypothetical protein VFZ08_01305 [Terriglobia bacterium]|nr:hypothetical protein [Terriglobia bacterium]